MGRRTPCGSLTGGTTPGGGTTGRPGITPGALSMAGGNTPYGGTPGNIIRIFSAYQREYFFSLATYTIL